MSPSRRNRKTAGGEKSDKPELVYKGNTISKNSPLFRAFMALKALPDREQAGISALVEALAPLGLKEAIARLEERLDAVEKALAGAKPPEQPAALPEEASPASPASPKKKPARRRPARKSARAASPAAPSEPVETVEERHARMARMEAADKKKLAALEKAKSRAPMQPVSREKTLEAVKDMEKPKKPGRRRPARPKKSPEPKQPT